MSKIVYVIGTNGCGKSEIVKGVLRGGDVERKFIQDEKCWYCKSGDVIALGKYETKCGGADEINGIYKRLKIIHRLSVEYPKHTIVSENSVFTINSTLNFLLEMKEKGNDVLLILVEANIGVCINRVIRRNGRNPNAKLVMARKNTANRVYEVYSKCGLKCLRIDTTHLDIGNCVMEFRRMIR